MKLTSLVSCYLNYLTLNDVDLRLFTKQLANRTFTDQLVDINYLFSRSMIGHPTNFQHTGHVGTGDIEMPNDHLRALQNQMRSKGGYATTYKVSSKSFYYWNCY